MNINLKNYQDKAVNELVAIFKTLLFKEEQKKVCVFQAPTGSGKTLMTAKFIEEIIRELPEVDLCFVWISIGKGELHLQSKRSLNKIFGGAPRVSLVEEEFTGDRERIVRNEVVVVNWEKLRSKEKETGDWKNLLMKDGEKLNFRDILSKTREQRKIIMIIDESHIGATAERTNELREEINADVILEMSATPKIKPDPKELARGTAGYIFVEPKEVIEEEMIKKELIINEKINEITDNESDSQQVVLETAFKKRNELKKLFELEKSNINPLVLIQIPAAEAGEDKIKAIKLFLANNGVTERKEGQGNGKLAIWLSEQKSEMLDFIAEPDNEIEFLIFKQAIDTGWDCPRAHILVKFRESHSETFEIQTVGRILRMPEQKHYASEDLNRGYIYTNVQSIIVKKEEYNPNIIKHLKATRKDVYEQINLTSYYKSRADYGDITSSFTPIFEKIACEYFKLSESETVIQNVKKVNSKGIILDIKKYQQEIIANAKIEGESFDEIEGKIDSVDRARLMIAGNDLQALFEQIIKDNLGSFANIKRSVPAVKTAIYSWFRKYIGSKEWTEEMMLIQIIIVNNSHRKQFEEILASAIEKYKTVREKEVLKRIEESEQWYNFEISKETFFNQHADEKVEFEKYVYEPCYLSASRLMPEKNFEKFLDENNEKISWWWKNGENKQDYFGVKYEYPVGIIHTFYPDYLVKLINGQIGILEVKDMHDQDGGSKTKIKAEELQKFIKHYTDKNLFGGIVIQKNDGWKINKKDLYDWNKCEKKDWSEWENLIF